MVLFIEIRILLRMTFFFYDIFLFVEHLCVDPSDCPLCVKKAMAEVGQSLRPVVLNPVQGSYFFHFEVYFLIIFCF